MTTNQVTISDFLNKQYVLSTDTTNERKSELREMAKNIPKLSIGSNNLPMPVIGFGTAAWPLTGSVAMKDAIIEAIRIGYRHFDTAAVYNSEGTLGEAIAEAMDLGLIKSRNELFITSKLWIIDGHHDRVIPALESSLRRLGLKYLDLYLLHQPVSLKAGGYDVPFRSEDLVAMDFKSVWEAMEECHTLGLTKNIGVSNFSCEKLRQLLLTAKIAPAVNQVEMNPLWQQTKLRKFCEENGITIAAYSPLGGGGTVWGTNNVLDNDLLKEIAHSNRKAIAQVCLRWVYEQGVTMVVKSFNNQRLKENISIFDWILSPQDNEKIKQIPQQRTVLAVEYTSENGPYKSLQEFWDSEI